MKKNSIFNESEMNEMGLDLSRLSRTQPRNYLVKRLKNVEKESEKKQRIYQYQKIFLSAIEDIKNLDWDDLIIKEESKDNFWFYFPKEIDKKLRSSWSLKNSRLNYRDDMLDKRFNLFLILSENRKFPYNIELYMESDRNRTHFPGGLPEWLLGLGLGVKVYRKLLNKVGYIQSTDSASDDVKKLYSILIQMEDVNCAVTKDSTLVIEKSLPKDRKAAILGEYILELYKLKYPRKIQLNKEIILDSYLLRELGVNKVVKFLDEIFLYNKKIGRKAFSSIDFGQFPIDDEQ